MKIAEPVSRQNWELYQIVSDRYKEEYKDIERYKEIQSLFLQSSLAL